MDIVYINDLKVDTVIGIFDWERRIRQTVSLDLEMAADIRKGAASDHIDDALDYKAIGGSKTQWVIRNKPPGCI